MGINLAVGNNKIIIKAVDVKNNSAIKTINIYRKDVTPPNFEINYPSVVQENYAILQINARDESELQEIRINSDYVFNIKGKECNILNKVMLQPGSNVITVKVVDIFDNVASKSVTSVYANNLDNHGKNASKANISEKHLDKG